MSYTCRDAGFVQSCIDDGKTIPPGTYHIDKPLDLSRANGGRGGAMIGEGVTLVAPGPCVAPAPRTETATDPGGALDNPSAPRIVEGMCCPGCKRKHTVEVVYGSVSHAGKTWARAVYTCVCCEWHDVRGQR